MHRVGPLVGAVQRLGGLDAVLRDLPAEKETLLHGSHSGFGWGNWGNLQMCGERLCRASPAKHGLCVVGIKQRLKLQEVGTFVSGAFCSEGSRVS